MLKAAVLVFFTSLFSVSAALAQSQPATPPYVQHKGGYVYLTNITSLGVETKLSDGRVLTAPRHQVGGSAAYFSPDKCPGSGGKPCVGLPAPRPFTLFFHESELEADASARNLFAVCRRKMESASSGTLIELQGDFETLENPAFIIFHALKSCVVKRR